MKTAYYKCSLGTLRMVYENDTLFALNAGDFVPENSVTSPFTESVYRQICEFLCGKRKKFDVKYELHGTDFQEKVWHILETIPYGSTISYAEAAERIGNPKAARAVGGACNKNPIWLIVPCHRVIGANGRLTGYACGIDMKEKLLSIEKEYANEI